jgi:hypothetical protein
MVGGAVTGYLGASIVGHATSSFLPGMLSTTAGMGGAYVGVRGFSAAAKLGGAAWRNKTLTLGLAGAVAVGAAPLMYTAAAYGASAVVMKAGYNHAQMQKQLHTSGSLASFNTQGAYTMRARAVQAIHKSHLNARSVLGQEASFLHYPSRNYSSRYRM